MVAPKDFNVILSFESGLNTRSPRTGVAPAECSEGKNFDLSLDAGSFKPREGFQNPGTATNTSEIRGFAQLVKSTGEISTLVQAGNTVYEWDWGSTFTSKGTVNASARLRGPIRQNWLLDDRVIITDLELRENVKTWNGAALVDMPHNLGGDFKAKYAAVIGERAYFSNIVSGIAVPHMLVGSEISDMGVLSVSDRPSSSLGSADPFFLLSNDLRPINGILEAFGQTIFSTERGRLFQLSGSDAQDFALESLYPNSAATGDEGITFIGNDIAYSRARKIESLQGTLNFGDVEADDLSRAIASKVQDHTEFQILYDPTTQVVYCWPPGSDEIYVFHKGVQEGSPWSLWQTAHSSDFRKTAAMVMRDPGDGLEKLVWGGEGGNVYVMNGGVGDDSTAVVASRTSAMFYPPLDGRIYDISGWIRYKTIDYPIDVTVTLLYAGDTPLEDSNTITIGAPSDANHFGSAIYFGGENYFGSNPEPREQPLRFVGKGRGFRVKVEVASTGKFEIQEVGLGLKAAS